ncbi:chemotaxis regulatory protein ChePep isoform X1 [Leptopilina heterotoma]|uniref:chemotaxis regulatory protein ChePep isoform X1 n=1 Tax=Leptopilina heterotoma TaxID=63436 RepID=UPI001CA9F225|nr:chemotaxis regulatory protein ChePep isoform X1 [Leptopilina heterotoma]
MCTVSHTEPIATPSIIERKTSEDLPSRFPSSPPPTPIDPSPLQQAQQAAASATALAEALKLPAEAASNHQQSISLSSSQSFDEHTDTPKESIIANVPQVDQEEAKKEYTTKETPVPIDNDSTIAQVQCEKTTKEPNDAVKAENELVIQTEEGPIPVTENQTFEARPAMVIPEDKKVEILLDVGGIKDEISSTTVSDQMFAAGEKILPAECNSQESFTSASEPIVRTSEESDDIPPPLPESPAPALQETSKFLNFMNAEIPPLDLPEPIHESLIEISHQVHETLAETHQIPEGALESLSEKVPEILAETQKEEQVPESFTETYKVLESLAETQKVLEEIPESLTEIHKVLEVVAESLAETQKVLETPETLAETQKVVETPESLSETLVETQKVLETPESLSETLAETQKVLETPESLPETPKDLESTLETLTEDKVLEETTDHENTLETLPEIAKVLEETKETPKDKKEILEDKDEKIEIADITDSLELPPVIQQELITCDDDSFTYPLPPDDVSTRKESPRIPMDSILTPPQSPNPGSVNCTMTTTTGTCNLEPMSENDSMMMERLADNQTQASQLSNGHVAADDHQSTSEPEAPVENNVSANEVSTTESADEAPKVPPPAVPVEVTVAPALAPVITEDVASVTKAIEEIDITEKAVAAAVKEAIENSNANEIVVDSNHQSHLNE